MRLYNRRGPKKHHRNGSRTRLFETLEHRRVLAALLESEPNPDWSQADVVVPGAESQVPEIRRAVVHGTLSPNDRDVFRIDAADNERVEVFLTQTDDAFQPSPIQPYDQTVRLFPLTHQFSFAPHAHTLGTISGGIHFVSVESSSENDRDQFYVLTILTYAGLDIADDSGDPGDTLDQPTRPTFAVTESLRSAQIAGGFQHSEFPEGDIDYFALGPLATGQGFDVSVTAPQWNTAAVQIEVVNADGVAVAGLNRDGNRVSGQVTADGEYIAKLTSNAAGPDTQYVLSIVTSDTDAPQVVFVDGLPESGQLGDAPLYDAPLYDVRVATSESIHPDSLHDRALELREAGPDGLFDTADDRDFQLISSATELENGSPGIRAQIDDGPIADGLYRLTVTPTVTDRHGNALQEAFVKTFSIDFLEDGDVFETSFNHSPVAARQIDLIEDPGQTGWLTSARAVGTIEERGWYRTEDRLVRGDIDYWAFDGQAGDTVYVVDEWTEFRVGNRLPTLGRLDSQGNYEALVQRTNSSTAIKYRLPETGRYYLRKSDLHGYGLSRSARPEQENSPAVTSSSITLTGGLIQFSQLGEYRFSLRVSRLPEGETPEGDEEENGSIETAEPITWVAEEGSANATVGATIDREGDVDVFRIGPLSVSNQIAVDASSIPGWSAAAPQIKILLGDADLGKPPLEVVDDDPDPAVFSGTVSTGGEYFLHVSHDPAQSLSGDPYADQYAFTVSVIDQLGPRVAFIDGLPESGGVTHRLIDRFVLHFDSEIVVADYSGVVIGATSAGPDGQFDTGDDFAHPVIVRPGAEAQSVTVSILDGPLTLGNHRLRLFSGITDIAGNPVVGEGDAPFVHEFSVVQAAVERIYEHPHSDLPEQAAVLPFQDDPEGTGWSRSKVGYGTSRSTSDVDWWRIAAQAGERFEVIAESLPTATLGNGYPPQLAIYHWQPGNGGAGEAVEVPDSQLRVITRRLFPGRGVQHRVSVDAIESGDYLIAASTRSQNQSGDYEIQVLKSVGSNTASAVQAIQAFRRELNDVVTEPFAGGLAATVRGQFSGDFSASRFRIAYLRAGDRITVDPARLTAWSNEPLPTLSLYAESRYNPTQGFGVANESADGNAFAATAPADGWYYLRVDQNPLAAKSEVQFAVDVRIEDTRAPLVENFLGIPTFDGFTGNAISSFNIYFSEPTDIAAHPDKMDLRSPGPDRVFDTADDVRFDPAIEYNPDTMLLTVRLLDKWFAGDTYRLSFSGDITDSAGRRFDGNGDGIEGDAYRHHFTVGAIPDGRIFDTATNDQPAMATPIPVDRADGTGAGWVRSPLATGRLQSSDQIDWWRFNIAEPNGFRVQIDSFGTLSDKRRTEWTLGLLDPETGRVDPLAVDHDGDHSPRFELTRSPGDATLVLGAKVLEDGASDKMPVDLSYEISIVQNERYPIFSGHTLNGDNTPIEIELPLSRHKDRSIGTLAGVLEGDRKQTVYFLGTLDAGTPVELNLTTLDAWSFDNPRVRIEGLAVDGTSLDAAFIDTDVNEERLAGTIPADGQYFAVVEYQSVTLDGFRYSHYPGPATWTEANAAAMARGASLVSIHSWHVNFELRRRFGTNVWIGLSNVADLQSYQWSDGTPADYLNWGQSGLPTGAAHYAYIGTNGRWSPGQVDETRGWIEQRYIGTTLDDSKSIHYLMDLSIGDPTPVQVASVSGLPNRLYDDVTPSGPEMLTDSFTMSFSESIDIRTIVDAARVLSPGPDGVFETTDDFSHPLTFQIDESSAPTRDIRRVLGIMTEGPLASGTYRLVIDDSLRSQTAIGFDGDGDGTVGGSFRYDFDVTALAERDRSESSRNDLAEDAGPIELYPDPNGTGWRSSGWAWGVADSDDDVDWWSFDAAQGQRLEVLLSMPATASYRLGASLYRVDPVTEDMQFVDDQYFRFRASTQMLATIDQTGRYLIKIEKTPYYGDSGAPRTQDYRLHVATFDGGQLASEEQISDNSSAVNALLFESDLMVRSASMGASAFADDSNAMRTDSFLLGELGDGENVTVTIRRAVWNGQPSLLSIVDSLGHEVASALAADEFVSLSFVAQSDRTYKIVVAHEHGSDVDSYYALDATAMPAAVTLPAGSVLLNASVPDDLSAPAIAGPETEVQFVGGWTAAEPVMSGDRLYHRLNGDGGEVIIATENPWTNPLDRFDVDLNGTVTPRDALLLINRLASDQGGGELTLRGRDPAARHRYFDVTGDGTLTPRDALVVINRLAGVGPGGRTPTSGEAEETDGNWKACVVDEAVSTIF